MRTIVINGPVAWASVGQPVNLSVSLSVARALFLLIRDRQMAQLRFRAAITSYHIAVITCLSFL